MKIFTTGHLADRTEHGSVQNPPADFADITRGVLVVPFQRNSQDRATRGELDSPKNIMTD